MIGRVFTTAEGDKVKLLMTDGQEVASVLMSPEIALEVAMDLIKAAGEAKR